MRARRGGRHTAGRALLPAGSYGAKESLHPHTKVKPFANHVVLFLNDAFERLLGFNLSVPNLLAACLPPPRAGRVCKPSAELPEPGQLLAFP